MLLQEWLAGAISKLETAGIGTARLDCLVLLEDASGHDRLWLLAHPEYQLPSHLVDRLANQLEKRAGHEPLAYIRGKTEFYGREFMIDHTVLEPRPESETMIDLIKQGLELSAESKEPCIVDVGTGSGAMAITAKLEIPKAEVIGTDIDPSCLVTAKKNARLHQVNIEFIKGDLLEPLVARQLSNSPLVLLCNLPYVPDSFTINPAAMREPHIAIFGGADGLDIYRRLFTQIEELRLKVDYILTESMPPQHDKLTEIARRYGYQQQKTEDFIQVFRNS